MINLSSYQKILGMSGQTIGQVHKTESDMIMNATWDRDIQSRTCYLYDYYHDDEPDKNYDLHPENSRAKVPIDAKYIISSYKTMDKDQVPYHLQFRPGQKCNVNYYKEVFADRYDARFPLGLYVDIPNNDGIYQRWLVVDFGYSYEPQFDTWCILPCDYRFQWIYDGKKYQMWGVTRSQNSYNSGIWLDFKITAPEDQQKFIIPLNRDSEKVYHNQRMIIDAKVETEPVAWLVSKIKRFVPNGIARFTLAQDNFDQYHDYIERDKSGRIIGMWADYYKEDVPLYESNNPIPKSLKSEITYSGLKPEIKVGGSYKTFTMNYYDNDNNVIDKETYNWKFELNNSSFNEEQLLKVLYPDITNKLSNNQVKIKFIGPDDYLNSILTISNEDTSLNVKIVGM